MMMVTGGVKDDNAPSHQRYQDDRSDKGDDGDSHQGGQSINLTVIKPRDLPPYTVTGSRTSTPVRKTPSIPSAEKGGEGGGEGVGTVTPSMTTTRCVYTKGGVCREHGEGARKHYMETFIGENGEKRRRVKERRVYYVCDTDLTGMKKLRQTKISFTRKQFSGEGGGDTSSKTRGDLGENCGSLTTSTEGKSTGPTMEN